MLNKRSVIIYGIVLENNYLLTPIFSPKNDILAIFNFFTSVPTIVEVLRFKIRECINLYQYRIMKLLFFFYSKIKFIWTSKYFVIGFFTNTRIKSGEIMKNGCQLAGFVMVIGMHIVYLWSWSWYSHVVLAMDCWKQK